MTSLATDKDMSPIRRANALLIRLVAVAAGFAILVAAAGARVALGDDAAGTGPAEIAYASGGWIYVMRDDGTARRRLTRGSSPAWSPDGRLIAFSHFDRLHVIGADGTDRRRLTHPKGPHDFSPAWSPDGRRIAFVSRRAGAEEIYIVNAEGSGLRRVTRLARSGNGSFAPDWSPDGRLIAFSSAGPTPENPELYVIRPDGSGLRRLTHTGGDVHSFGDDGFPDWSPDGRRIVFSSNRGGSGALWVIRRDGKGERRLLDFARTDEWWPRFSPEGRRVAFARFYSDRSEVWVANADGTGARRLATGAEPSWRPVR